MSMAELPSNQEFDQIRDLTDGSFDPAEYLGLDIDSQSVRAFLAEQVLRRTNIGITPGQARIDGEVEARRVLGGQQIHLHRFFGSSTR